MSVDYNHAKNLHSLGGPQAALPVLFANSRPASLLDVGCGTGTWLRAALDFGIADVFGVDGVEIPRDKLQVSTEKVRHQDLAEPWNLGKQFDIVICFEVAEHLDKAFAPILVDALVRHGDVIYFSAACPGQGGQHHVNCQWPTYWQKLFNDRGYACCDALRWQLWELEAVEPWYRQNLFAARHAPQEAGKEPRIPSVIHPEMMPWFESGMAAEAFSAHVNQIQKGRMTLGWYLSIPFRALSTKLKRRLH